ncbi:MAG: undecaprenyldiphospho-muramoylpentapeptide beta-N-acetylglucosaminyltransferase [Candidatus Paceibacterota bacterium]|jgi:UDP-N-acetylglucosamine--N-acetylmuramyl-(pentapeptide) pyrophosphoryl-undecaprenol N-acetylglucosamine transferase
MKILVTGGGTGGHITPILAVVSEIKKIAREKKIPEPEFMLITPDEYFKEAIELSGIKVRKIRAGKLRRYFDLKNFTDIYKIFVGIVQSLYFIRKFSPDVVFSKGGFASVPAVFASWLLGIPTVTHESDITPGLANRINSFFASKVLVSFDETQKYFKKDKAVLTGNPIREDISTGNVERGIKTFGLSDGFPTLLVFGGSQGARCINEAVLDSLEVLLSRFNVIHVCGKYNFAAVREAAGKKGVKGIERYKLYPFLYNEMKDAYAVSDMIVSRAGASSIAEIIEVGKPSIIIPLSTSANDHQAKNAGWLLKKGLAKVIYEKDLNGESLKNELFELFVNRSAMEEMRRNIVAYKSSLKGKAAENVARIILSIEEETR